MADAIKTLGCVLYVSSEIGSPQTWVAVGNFVSWNGPNRTRKIIDASNLSSEAASKLAGLIDGGTFDFVLNADPSVSSHQTIETAFSDGGIREWKLVLTDSGAAELHFNGIVKSLPFSGPFDDKGTQSVAVEITGKPWITL